MKLIRQLLLLIGVSVLAGCAAKQSITAFDEQPPKVVCIAEHQAVKEGVLGALEEGLQQHGARTAVVRAVYEEKHNMWDPRIYPDEVAGCDAIAFYVANWTWDISMYMYFANIWLTDKAMTKKLAQATYQTGGGPDKWINARKKILQMVDEMYASVGQQATAIPQTATAAKPDIPVASSPAPVGDDPIVVALQRLKSMYEAGVISEEEYTSKRQEILDSL